ncbi:MAG: hypothetical protein JXB49_28355 [Bacteroidales bacterium]|nr:hypothetical protein [Bacteroidales bacterium]
MNKVYQYIFFLLISGHLFINTYVQNLYVNIVVLGILAILTYSTFLAKYDFFDFLVVIYFVSHFSYAANQGGGFNILTFLVIVIFLLVKEDRPYELRFKDKTINALMIIFLCQNLLGWIFVNDTGLRNILLGIVSLLGYVMLFYLSSHLRLDQRRIRLFIFATMILSLYSSLVIVNNYFKIISVQSPMMPSATRFGSNVQAGMMGWSEMSGEHGLLTAIFFSIILISQGSKLYFVKNSLLYLGLLSSLFNLVMSRSRSVLLLIILFYIVIGFYFAIKVRWKGTSVMRLFFGIVLAILLLSYFGDMIGADYLQNRFKVLNVTDITVESVLSGESINRDYAFSFFFERLDDRDWWIGYGWGSNLSNRIAWFFNPETPRAGYHSLYLSLPMLFGWIGALAFLCIFLVILKRLFLILRAKEKSYFLDPFGLAFFFMFVFFLINEYKIEAIRTPHYFMIIWIWLGLANSTYKNYKLHLNENSLVGSISD